MAGIVFGCRFQTQLQSIPMSQYSNLEGEEVKVTKKVEIKKDNDNNNQNQNQVMQAPCCRAMH